MLGGDCGRASVAIAALSSWGATGPHAACPSLGLLAVLSASPGTGCQMEHVLQRPALCLWLLLEALSSSQSWIWGVGAEERTIKEPGNWCDGLGARGLEGAGEEPGLSAGTPASPLGSLPLFWGSSGTSNSAHPLHPSHSILPALAQAGSSSSAPRHSAVPSRLTPVIPNSHSSVVSPQPRASPGDAVEKGSRGSTDSCLQCSPEPMSHFSSQHRGQSQKSPLENVGRKTPALSSPWKVHGEAIQSLKP